MINLDVIANTFKLKYNVLDKTFSKFNSKKYRYLLVIDISKILDIMSATIIKKQLMVTNTQKTKLMISILNIVAHYRHYYFNNPRCSNSILLYCQTQEKYHEYKEIITELNSIIQFLPNIILLPDLQDRSRGNRYFYTHVVAYIISHTNKISHNNNQELILNILGNNPLEYQFLNICDKSFCFLTLQNDDNKKIVNYQKLWEHLLGEDERFFNPVYQLGLKELLIPYCLLYKKIETKKTLNLVSNDNTRKKRDNLFHFFNRVPDPGIAEYADTLVSNFSDFVKAYNEVMYTCDASIKLFIKDIMKFLNKKLKDNKLQNINEYNKIFEENNINISWLTEDGCH